MAVTCLMRSTEKAKVRGFSSLVVCHCKGSVCMGYDYIRDCRASAVLALLVMTQIYQSTLDMSPRVCDT